MAGCVLTDSQCWRRWVKRRGYAQTNYAQISMDRRLQSKWLKWHGAACQHSVTSGCVAVPAVFVSQRWRRGRERFERWRENVEKWLADWVVERTRSSNKLTERVLQQQLQSATATAMDSDSDRAVWLWGLALVWLFGPAGYCQLEGE